MEETRKEKTWVNVVGFVLLLMGIFGVLRTAINLVAFEKYPMSGVYPSIPVAFGNYQSVTQIYPKESDCTVYTPLYYGPDNITPREPTSQEKTNNDLQQQSCLEGVKEARNAAKINDLSQSILALFIGVGVLSYRRFFKSN